MSSSALKLDDSWKDIQNKKSNRSSEVSSTSLDYAIFMHSISDDNFINPRPFYSQESDIAKKSVQVNDVVEDIPISDSLSLHILPQGPSQEINEIEETNEAASLVIKKYTERFKTIEKARVELKTKHELFVTLNEKIKASFVVSEISKLHGCKFVKEVTKAFVKEFGLIQELDILPDVIHQYLDFRYETQPCPLPIPKEEIKQMKERKKIKGTSLFRIKSPLDEEKKRRIVHSLRIVPDTIIFHNYELGKIYKRSAKLLNTGTHLQSFSLKSIPKLKNFSVELENDNKRAPGMTSSLTVTYKPKIYRDVIEHVSFKNSQGETATFIIKSTRDRPKLLTFILKSNMCLLERALPGTDGFKEKRQKALNSTIDCGSCFVGQYVLISLVVENVGMPAKFFIIPEEDWYYQDIEAVSIHLELQSGDFWIYPTYFELNNNEMMEIVVIFQPSRNGLHLETLFLICDNNSFNQVEIVGDALYFSNSYLQVDIPPTDKDISRKENYIVYFGHVPNKTTREFRITIHNNSCTYLKCTWNFSHKHKPQDTLQCLNTDWIFFKSFTDELIPYSSTDFVFEIFFNGVVQGYHSIFFNFLILDIPEIALMENEEFITVTRHGHLGYSLSESLDILVASFEVACFIDIAAVKKPHKCICDECHQTVLKQRVIFSSAILNFGILPTGLNIERELSIESITEEPVEWFIVELKYNIDIAPHAVVLDKPNVDCSNGTFSFKGQKKLLLYKFSTKVPARWVSMLIVATISEGLKQIRVESVCIVTYQAIQYEIVINTGHSDSILCPMKIMYRNIIEQVVVTIENFSPITGCFYFLKPIGNDKDKVNLEFDPQSSVLKPHQSMALSIKLSFKESGTFEDIYVPCFIGMRQEPIMLKILCTVDDIHVIFYLPDLAKSCQKIMWPPKTIYEFDGNPWFCPCEQKDCLSLSGPAELSNVDTRAHSSSSNIPINNLAEESLIWDQFPEFKSSETSDINITHESLKEILRNKFGKNMIFHDVMEVSEVVASQPRTISFYIQNLTPVKTTFTVEVQNFNATEDFDENDHRFIFNKKGSWNSLVDSKYGILVHPVKETGNITSYDWSKVDITIYANTWGIYLEEVTVDIADIQCYTFSLIIEVIGAPVFPIGLNAITEYPMIRFGTIPYKSSPCRRKVEIRNESCVPMKILWDSFLKTNENEVEETNKRFSVTFQLNDIFEKKGQLLILDDYYGEGATEFCEIIPAELIIQAKSNAFIEILIKPSYFKEEMTKQVTCHAVGQIYLEQKYRLQPYYFYRETKSVSKKMKIQIDITLISPSLEINCGCRNFQFQIYANQILVDQTYSVSNRMVFRNKDLMAFTVRIVVPEPFYLIVNNKMKSKGTFNVDPCRTIEVDLSCTLELDQLFQLSRLVYEDNIPEEDKKDIVNCRYNVDKDTKILKLFYEGRIFHSLGPEKVFPLGLCIHFPNITVKPHELDFDCVLIGDTDKTYIVLYNMTEYKIKFEIYKSSTAENFFVTPHYGEIPGNSGINKQFVYIFVYFTPRECKLYQESFRIVTSIPKYYVEIPLKGSGTLNEKFHVTYKI